MKKIDVKIIGLNNFQIMYKCFEDINCTINNIDYKISYSTLAMNISIQTEMEKINVEEEFWQLYDYIGFILGYYPVIDSAIIAAENGINNIHLANIVEKYKTSNDFILEETQFIDKINNKLFEITYAKFKKVKKTIDFQISVYNISMMKNNNYPEIRITNILQALDGLYDYLSITKDKRMIVKNKDEIIKLKEYINNINLNDYITNDDDRNIVKTQIKNCINRLEFVNYDTKIRNLFNYMNNNYNIFDLEIAQKDENKNYEKFIMKCKHTRNKLSHVIEINNSFNGTESALYVFKIILVFRLLIIGEIGLKDNINKEILNKYISLINKRIVEELKLEEI